MANSSFQRCLVLVSVAVAGLILGSTPKAFGQAAKKLTIPKPETLTLDTQDGMVLHGTYFPGGFVQKSETEIVERPGKEVVPIVLLHGYEGRGADFGPLAVTLQRQGHAVIVPDLRGHGASNKIKFPNGTEREIELDKMNKKDFASMVNDIEAIKRFLYEKNNAGKLNVEFLCLVGAELGGMVATNWVALDWNRKQLPAFKQGRSVKALVLLSPMNSLKGYNSSAAWTHPVFQDSRFSLMLIAGKRDSKSTGEAKQINNRLERFHPLPADEADRMKKQSLFLIDPDTELSGTKLVDPRSRLTVYQDIAGFITRRLVNRKEDAEFAWSERKNPLSGN